MISLYLVDIETGLVIGTHQSEALPARGDIIDIIKDRRIVSLEILDLETTRANKSDMFTRDEHWATCRLQVS
jgi:hypothetical protein